MTANDQNDNASPQPQPAPDPAPQPAPPPHSDDDGWLEWVRKGDNEPATGEGWIRRIIAPNETNTVKRILEDK